MTPRRSEGAEDDHDAFEDGHRAPGAGTSPRVGVLVGLALMVLCGLLAVGAAVVVSGLRGAKQHGYEVAAIGALKTIHSSQEFFRQRDRDGRYGDLRELGDAGLVDGVLASGTKQGYQFAVRPSATNPDRLWAATASPAVTGRDGSGERYFFINQTGGIYYRLDRPFDLSDPTCAAPAGRSPSAGDIRAAGALR